MSCAVCHMVLMTVSSGILASAGSLASASVDAVIALTAPIVFRSMQGICTSPATGSQVRPRWCSSAISAAMATWPGEPPRHWVRPAAAMALETPISA